MFVFVLIVVTSGHNAVSIRHIATVFENITRTALEAEYVIRIRSQAKLVCNDKVFQIYFDNHTYPKSDQGL